MEKEKPIWSSQQKAIFNAIQAFDSNYIIEAVAGSGKSTTLEHGVKFCKAGKSVLVLAFNKAIADELRTRIPHPIEVKTFHSFGYAICRAGFGKPQVTPSKLTKLIRAELSDKEMDDYGYSIKKMVSLIKNGCTFEPTRQDWLDVLGAFDILIPDGCENNAIEVADRVFIKSVKDCATIDFDDQLFMPILYDLKFPSYDYIFIDEAQDLSPIQHLMLERLLASDGHIYAVGDTHQAIYGFRGADHNSMNRFRSIFQCQDLPLSTTYRCSIAVTQEAQKLVPHIEHTSWAEGGEVLHIEKFKDWTGIDDSTIVMCRNNAPIFKIGMLFVRAQKPVNVSTNFNGLLKKFVKQFKTKDIDIFNMRVKAYFEKQGEIFLRKDQHIKYSILKDKCESVLICAEGCATVQALLNHLDKLFNKSSGPTICTIHKAKGREAPLAILYKPSLIPSKWAKSDSALQQEDNLKYVAITRAKTTLIFAEN